MQRWGCVLAIGVATMGSVSVAAAADGTEQEKTLAQVFDVPGHSKAQVYAAGRQWIAENFRSAKAVIEYENADEGTIIGNGNIDYPCASAWECLGKPDWKVPFTMRLEAKDDRFRLTFTRVHLYWPAKINAGVRQPEHDAPVRSEKDMAKIRPKLLGFGTAIQASMEQRKTTDNW